MKSDDLPQLLPFRDTYNMYVRMAAAAANGKLGAGGA